MTLWLGLTNVKELREFAYWILNIGDKKLGGPNDEEVTIDIHKDLLIKDASNLKATIVDCIYPQFKRGEFIVLTFMGEQY